MLETVTSTAPGPCAGVTAVRVVAETKVTEVVATPPKVTVASGVKSVPSSVTVSPPACAPPVRETVVNAGGLSYVKGTDAGGAAIEVSDDDTTPDA